MHKCVRVEAPEKLKQGAQTWNKNWHALYRAYQQDGVAKPQFSWRGCDGAIREALGQMTQMHCAFCDELLGVSSRFTVEHFRPKSGGNAFPELAYTWDNLYPACDLCQSKKGAKFDEDLLCPDALTYCFEDYFIAEFSTGKVISRPGLAPDRQRRAEVTIALYGFNSEQRPMARKRVWERYVALSKDPRNNAMLELAHWPFRHFLA